MALRDRMLMLKHISDFVDRVSTLLGAPDGADELELDLNLLPDSTIEALEQLVVTTENNERAASGSSNSNAAASSSNSTLPALLSLPALPPLPSPASLSDAIGAAAEQSQLQAPAELTLPPLGVLNASMTQAQAHLFATQSVVYASQAQRRSSPAALAPNSNALAGDGDGDSLMLAGSSDSSDPFAFPTSQ